MISLCETDQYIKISEAYVKENQTHRISKQIKNYQYTCTSEPSLVHVYC